jgi:hypothetical protein
MPLGGNVALRAQFAKLFTSRLAYIDEILHMNYDAPSLTYPSVFNVRDSKRAYEEFVEITGLGTFTPKSEGDMIDYDKVMQGWSTRFEHTTYAKGVQISMETAADDLDGAIVDMMPALAMSARVSIETTIWNVLNNGFSTTLTPDGVSLFNDTHVLRGGGSYDNLLTGDLSIANLESAINMFDNMIDDRGLPIELSPTKLVFGPAYRWLVHEILASERRSDTANNAANAFKTIAIQPVMTKYIAGSDDWFVCSEPSQHRVIAYWRMEPVSDHTIDFDTGNLKTKMTYRLSTGAASWRGWVGSQG